MLNVGDSLAGYEILAHLKSGGMATLFLARDRRVPDAPVMAMKVVHEHLTEDSRLTRMFLDEGDLSTRIDHPNVVKVHSYGEAAGVYFIIMEYVHGCSLAQLLDGLSKRRRRMAPELATYIAMAIADGLHAAHETRGDDGALLNVVHRDISPQNVLLSSTGDVKLIDFGIAKSQAGLHHSMTGTSIKGKLRYMSPEHALGKSVDRRTDVYALGIVLWEMLTMRPLFWARSDFQLLAKVQEPVLRPIRRYAPKVVEELEQAVFRALAVDREQRPPTAADFRRELVAAVPFVDALDHEQVAELLDTVLGDELDRAGAEIPAAASAEIGLDQLSETTITRRFTPDGEPRLRPALDNLTMPYQAPEPVKEEPVGPDSEPGIAEALARERTHEAAAHPDDTPLPDDPTEMMSRAELEALYGTFTDPALRGRRPSSIPPPRTRSSIPAPKAASVFPADSTTPVSGRPGLREVLSSRKALLLALAVLGSAGFCLAATITWLFVRP